MLSNIKKNTFDIINFYKLIFRDVFSLYFRFINTLGAIKVLRFIFVAYILLQSIYLISKYFSIFKFSIFSLNNSFYLDLLGIIFIALVFPSLFMIEKFYSINIIRSFYPKGDHVEPDDKLDSQNIFINIVQDLQKFYSIQNTFLVFILSQGKILIDIISLVIILIFYILIFNYQILLSFDLLNIFYMSIFIILFPILTILGMYIFRNTIFIFAFWRNEDNLNLQKAFKENDKFTNKKKRKFWLKYLLFRILQILSIIIFLNIIYNYGYLLYLYLNKFINLDIAFLITIILFIFISFIFFCFLSLTDSIFWVRLHRYLDKGHIDESYRSVYKYKLHNHNIIYFINLSILFFLTIISIYLTYIHFTQSKNILINENLSPPRIIKMYDENLVSKKNLQDYFSINYANGIGLSLFINNDNLEKVLSVKPLSPEFTSLMVPSLLNVLDNATFNIAQTLVSNDISISLDEAIENANQKQITLFIYINDIKSADLLIDNLKSKNGFYIVLFTDSQNISNKLAKVLPSIRSGLLSNSVNLENYKSKVFLSLDKNINNFNLQKFKERNIKFYLIMGKDAQLANDIKVESVQGIMTNLPKLSYVEIRNKTESELVKELLYYPLRYFGF